MNTLEIITQSVREQIEARRAQGARPLRRPLSLERALRDSHSGIIAEFKRASPSEGAFGQHTDPVAVARSYVEAGATALSILTEAKHFGGSLEDLSRVRVALPEIPLLMKDFVLEEGQILEGYLAGADAILLIVAALVPRRLRELGAFAKSLGLSVLVEVHNEAELDEALHMGARLIGINNRDLKTLRTSTEVSRRLVAQVPPGHVLVSESGLLHGRDVAELRARGFQGFLVGTHFLRHANPGEALARFRKESL